MRTVIAVATEKEDVRATLLHQAGSLDEGPIGGAAVQDLDWGAVRGDAVGVEFLEHDGGGMGAVCVTAGAAAAEGVAVDLVDDIEGAVGVGEACGVDGPALPERRQEC